jgi:ABC-2 type transport system ATP-binding protein
MIRTQQLSKHFARKHAEPSVAVDRLDLEVATGEVFGFLGPNGAGKTTTMRMLACLVGPTSGAAWINGIRVGTDDTTIRRSVGILTETPGLYDRLSVQKNLTIFARLCDVDQPDKQVEKYLRMLDLWSRRSDPAGSLSKGMRQKLAICRALVHEPQVLFLDEPTSGLDPAAAKLVHDFILELKSEGRTIFLCTHNLDEAERLCDRIGVMKQHLLRVDTPERLRQQLSGRRIVFHVRAEDVRHLPALQALPFVRSAQAVTETDGAGLVVDLTDPLAQNPVIVRALVEAGADLRFVGELRRSLEEVYLSLVGTQGAE